MRNRMPILMFLLAALFPFVCLGDSWSPPKVQTYFSETKAHRFTVRPPDLSSLHAFLALDREDFLMVNILEKGNTNRQIYCEGLLERRNDKGDYEVLWRRPLLNRVAPASVLISEVPVAGASGPVQVVTFDDWHHVGTSSNTVVIYSTSGTLLRRYSLADLIPNSDIQQLQRSVSSVKWRENVSTEPQKQRLVLSIPKRKPVLINLETGEVIR